MSAVHIAAAQSTDSPTRRLGSEACAPGMAHDRLADVGLHAYRSIISWQFRLAKKML
jgi:hypothetical protein